MLTLGQALREGPPPTAEQQETDRKQKLLERARERFHIASEAEQSNREEMLEAFNFYAGEHWSEAEKKDRQAQGNQPSLVIDRIKPSTKRVVNHIRRNPIACKAIPAGDGSSKEAAQAFTDISRHIDEDSRADIHVEGAYEDAAIAGLGWYRINVAWDGDRSFNRKITVEGFDSPFRVYRDPEAKEFDFSDMRYAFVTGDMSVEAFRSKYPNTRVASLANFTGMGDELKTDWFPEGNVRTAEYWYVDSKPVTIALLPDGSVVDADEVPEGIKPVDTRETEQKTVRSALITGLDVIEETEWEAPWVPLIPVIGDRVLLNGRRVMRGMVFDAKDASMLLDYMMSKLALTVGLAPISPLIAAAGAIEGFEQMWHDANKFPRGVLTYNQRDPETGQVFDRPVRLEASPEIAAIMSGIALAVDNIKAQLDFYDASLGNEGPEVSGKAILARQAASDQGHFNYADNLARSRHHEGRIKLALIPKVYNRNQIISITDPDGDERKLQLVATEGNPQVRVDQDNGKVYDLDASKYKIVVSTGPSFQTRRQESLEFLMELARMFPQQMGPALPMLIRTTDAPDADKIAQIIDPEAGKENAMPPQAMAEIEKRQRLLDIAAKALEQLQKKLDEKQLELASRERIAARDNQTQLVIAANKTQSAESMALLNAELQQRQASEDELSRAKEPVGVS